MKQKKKLIFQADSDGVSPSVLLSSFNHANLESDSHWAIKQGQKSGCSSLGDFLASVREPSIQPLEPSPHSKNEYHFSSYPGRRRQKEHHLQGSCSEVGEAEEQQQRKAERELHRQMTQIQQSIEEKKKSQSCRLLFGKNNILENIVRGQKINNLKKNFIRKARRTSTYHSPVNFQIQEQKEGILYWKGLEVHPVVESIFNLLSVIQIITLLIVYSLSFVFEDLLAGDYSIVNALQVGSLLFYFVEIVMNIVTIKFSVGRRIEVLGDIVEFYMTNHFWVDFISFIILLIDIFSAQDFISYFRMFIVFKLPKCLEKIQKIQVYFVRNVYNEQYWELIKVFLVNFCYAHMIALALAAMANLSSHNSWLVEKGIAQAPWTQRYVWSAYWACNIMLTVGFGDIAAANHKEALCIILIETLSCLIMAYNVNKVGSILTNIRQEDQNRSKKFKIFRKLADQNAVSEELTFKINNYIEEHSNIKKKFNHQEDQEFLKELPSNLRTSYLREANRQILNKLVFFRSLLDRTLCNFSEVLEAKISHPQEIIKSLDDDFNPIILKQGHIGYICKKNGCSFNDSVADQVVVTSKDLPFLTSLDFISKIRPIYEIKSLRFSVIFKLEYESFIDIFRKSDMDYELYCFLRDKCRNIPDEFEVKACQFCDNYNHFKFTCPRLHYVPFEQQVINKYIFREKKDKNSRCGFKRSKDLKLTPVQYYRKVKGYNSNMVKGKRAPSNSISNRHQPKPLISQQASSESSLGNIRSSFIHSTEQRTRQIVEIELLKLQQKEQFIDQVWTLSLDFMTNFNSYFSQDNPKHLQEKFSLENRSRQRNLKLMMSQEKPEEAISQMIQNFTRNFNMSANFQQMASF